MAIQRLPIPSSDAGNWGTILNNFLKQTSPSSKGGLNYASTDPTISSVTSLAFGPDDEGYTYVNTTTNTIRRWSGTAWTTILSQSTPSNLKDYELRYLINRGEATVNAIFPKVDATASLPAIPDIEKTLSFTPSTGKAQLSSISIVAMGSVTNNIVLSSFEVNTAGTPVLYSFAPVTISNTNKTAVITTFISNPVITKTIVRAQIVMPVVNLDAAIEIVLTFKEVQ